MIDLDYINKLIDNNCIDKAISEIEKIGKQKDINALSFLITHLKTTENHKLRNSIALSLMDIGSSKAVEPIIELLKDPRTLGYRGTLLYALEPFDCSAHLELLIDYVINGNYEVRHNAKNLLESMKPDISDEDLLKSIVKVKRGIDELEDKQSVLLETLDALCNLRRY